MKNSDFDARDRISFNQVRQETKTFEKVLKRLGISIQVGSPLEEMCFSLLELEQRRQANNFDTMQDLRTLYRPAFGLYDIVRRIVRLHNRHGFSVLTDHLRLLNSGTVAQNVAAPTDRIAAKIFELLIGLVCLEIGTDIALDGPIESYGDNPDVLVTLEGHRWGFACKVTGGVSPITLFDRLRDGIDQIEKSPADLGCVIVNLKNEIDHEKTWPLVNRIDYEAGKDTPIYAAWANIETPLNMLRAHAIRRKMELVDINGAENVQALFSGKKSIPGAFLFLQTATRIQLMEGPVETMLRYLFLIDRGVSATDEIVLNKLNDVLQHH